MVNGGGWFVAVSEQLYTLPLLTSKRLELVWFMGIVTVALTKVVESTGKEKVPLLAVVVVVLVPLDEVRMTCSQCDIVEQVHLMMLYIQKVRKVFGASVGDALKANIML